MACYGHSFTLQWTGHTVQIKQISTLNFGMEISQKRDLLYMRYEFLTAMITNTAIFWIVMRCNLKDHHSHFKRTNIS
jgi:hypothetical protein